MSCLELCSEEGLRDTWDDPKSKERPGSGQDAVEDESDGEDGRLVLVNAGSP